MKIAHKNISMIDTFANNVLSLLSASADPPPAKALITKYAIATTTKIKTMTRGLMNSSILPSIQLNIPDTSFKPTVGAIGIFVDAVDDEGGCDMKWNGMKWNGMKCTLYIAPIISFRFIVVPPPPPPPPPLDSAVYDKINNRVCYWLYYRLSFRSV